MREYTATNTYAQIARNQKNIAMHSNPDSRRLCSLTVEQKQKIIDERERRVIHGIPHDQATLAHWARETFRLLRAPSQAVISRTLKEVLRPSLFPSSIHKRTRVGKCKELEVALLSWVNAQFAERICISGNLIKAQAQRLQEKINERLPPAKQSKLQFSNGWLCNFQRRCNLRSLRSHGEGGDADFDAVRERLPTIRRSLQMYKQEDIFNADEFGHFYALAPEKTIARERLPGRKKEKARLTYLACCNATGTEKLPLMCIGKAARPRCFEKRSGLELGFDYHHNGRAWMTSALFIGWLMRFSSYITRTDPMRRVALLVDNCADHGNVDSLPPLENVEVFFLPPNTTSQIQPMDAGVIAAVKARYRKMQYAYALDRFDADVNLVYKVDQLSGMRWMRDIWEGLPSQLIYNCWKHTGLLGDVGPPVSNEDVNVGIMDCLSSLISDCARSRIRVESLINPEGEEACLQDVDETALATEAANNILGESCNDCEDDGEMNYLQHLSNSEKLRSIVIAKHLFKLYDIRDLRVEGALEGLQRRLRRDQSRQRQQTLITSFFE